MIFLANVLEIVLFVSSGILYEGDAALLDTPVILKDVAMYNASSYYGMTTAGPTMMTGVWHVAWRHNRWQMSHMTIDRQFHLIIKYVRNVETSFNIKIVNVIVSRHWHIIPYEIPVFAR